MVDILEFFCEPSVFLEDSNFELSFFGIFLGSLCFVVFLAGNFISIAGYTSQDSQNYESIPTFFLSRSDYIKFHSFTYE